MTAPRRQPPLEDLADRLHSAAIRLLRRLRAEDRASDLSGPRLSALSVVVFGGPVSLTALAEAEQVRLPTISRLAAELERAGLVERVPDPGDRRVQRLRATARGKKLLQEGRARRVARLARELAGLKARDLDALARAAATLERLFGSPPPPLIRRR
jgi:DNA-binding MarR family transcriptional regulator